MNKLSFGLMTLLLVACGNTTPTDTVDSLVAHPDRLHAVEQQCANDDTRTGAAECSLAAQARRRLFFGNGPKYTPPKKPPSF
ncbi:MAG TPA: EexN family lipoprotein [Steroidobacteraceae bacterium]|nr:EexN family lipoprotein [Steroidobacteraceae bacterium]